MDPKLRRRLIIFAAIALIVGVMAAVVAAQPGTKLRTKWELARVRRVEKTSVVYLVPNASLRDDPKMGWRIGVLEPSEPVWRYEVKTLRLLPGCEIVLPSGKTLVVDGSSDSPSGAAFVNAATAAMTVMAAEVNRGRELVCRRVVVGKPPYDPIPTDLARGAQDANAPADANLTVYGRGAFESFGGEPFVVLTIPQKQAEESFSGVEWQYAVLQPDTLYVARGESGIRTITLEEAKRILRGQPPSTVEADLQLRGAGVFVVQLVVRDERR